MKGFVLMVAAGVAAIMGVLVGTVPVQVRDQGEVISCGPAVLGNGTRLAELACADVWAPMQTTAVVLFVAAAIMIVFGSLALRQAPGGSVAEVSRVSSAV